MRRGGRQGPGAASRHSPHTEDRELKPFPASHRRAQTDRQTPVPARTPVISPSHHVRGDGDPWWGLPIPRQVHKARGWALGQDGLARKGCPRTQCDQESWLSYTLGGGVSPQEDLLPPSYFPSPRPYFPVSWLGNLPTPHAFLASLLWHSGCGHLPASLS